MSDRKRYSDRERRIAAALDARFDEEIVRAVSLCCEELDMLEIDRRTLNAVSISAVGLLLLAELPKATRDQALRSIAAGCLRMVDEYPVMET